ncbi:TPA: DUF6384 family protein [Pseudomonas putida]
MTVSLSEQMGAMGLVDQLRHREMALQEHLDLPRRRAEVADRIRTYYQNQGIAFDDELVDQGVRAFFSRRLVFEAPPLTLAERILVQLGLARRTLLTLAGGLVMIFGLTQCWGGVVDSGRTIGIGKHADALVADNLALHTQIVASHQRLADLRERLRQAPDPAVATLVAEIAKVLPDEHLQFVVERPEQLTAQNRDPLMAQIDRVRPGLERARQAIATSQPLFATAEGVYPLRERLSALQQSASFQAARPYFDDLAEQAQTADHQLAQVRTAGDLATASSLINQLDLDIESVRGPLNAIDRQKQLSQRLKAAPLPAAERQQLMAFVDQAAQAITHKRWDAINAPLDQLQRYLEFARHALTLELVDRPGSRSGVERCYEASGCSEGSTRGKSWYLIVEALDGAGERVAVPINSVEDGERRWATQFGVRVSREEYLKVRQDKLDDGLIGQRRIGNKPANTLSLRFNSRTPRNPDMILNW